MNMMKTNEASRDDAERTMERVQSELAGQRVEFSRRRHGHGDRQRDGGIVASRSIPG